jgi:signal transduction histidine kinase
MLGGVTAESATLLSTLLSLPDGERAAVERELAAFARSAALGELAADVAHDVANPLFGVLGLVEILLEDASPGSDDRERLELLRKTGLEMRATLRTLLDFARPPDGEAARADLGEAVRSALGLLRHGVGKALPVEERYPDEPVFVACPPGLLAEAVLQLLLAARGDGRLSVHVEGNAVGIAPAGDEALGAVVAARIATDHGGTVERTTDGVTLTLPPA